MRRLFCIFVLASFAGCYEVAPADGEISTVPVTNNPHAMPGPMKSQGPMPAAF